MLLAKVFFNQRSNTGVLCCAVLLWGNVSCWPGMPGRVELAISGPVS
jgi:hypothetical protein